jgi:hypothetical protein
MAFSKTGRKPCIFTRVFIEKASLKGGIFLLMSRAFFMALRRAESVFGNRRYGIY